MEMSVHGNGASSGLVVTVLSHIKELVRQLEGHLGGGSDDLCRHLAAQISSLTDRSITRLISSTSFHHHLDAARKRPAADDPDANADASFKTAKKRKKTMADKKKRHQLRVSSAGNCPADDGHSWRKYGQKEILGAKHPRAYYRCTHRHSQGCFATKQVQRADEDPGLFDVVYLGDHTCVHRAAAAGPAATGVEAAPEHSTPGASSSPHSLSSNLTVKVERPAVGTELLQVQGPFALLATPASGCLVAQDSGPFSVPSTSDNWDVSPATSDSNHIVPFPPFDVAGADAQFVFEEVMSSAFDECVDGLDIDISSFFA